MSVLIAVSSSVISIACLLSIVDTNSEDRAISDYMKSANGTACCGGCHR